MATVFNHLPMKIALAKTSHFFSDDYLSPIFGHQAACQARHGKMRDFSTREIAARQDRGSDHDDLLSKLLAIHESKPKEFDMTGVGSVRLQTLGQAKLLTGIQWLITFQMAASNVFAGSDSTAATARGMVYWLLKHPEYQQRLTNELEEAHKAGKLSTVAQNEEVEQLPFFMACLWEAIRFHPQPGLTLPRVVPSKGLEISGHFLPRGVGLDLRAFGSQLIECRLSSDARPG